LKFWPRKTADGTVDVTIDTVPGVGVELGSLPAGVVRVEGESLRSVFLQQDHPVLLER